MKAKVNILKHVMHPLVRGSHRATYDDDDFNSFRRIASERHPPTHTHTQTHAHSDRHGLGSTVKFAKAAYDFACH